MAKQVAWVAVYVYPRGDEDIPRDHDLDDVCDLLRASLEAASKGDLHGLQIDVDTSWTYENDIEAQWDAEMDRFHEEALQDDAMRVLDMNRKLLSQD